MLAVSSSPAGSIIAKVTATTALGLTGDWLARRSRAALRHALLVAAFGVTLALPIASVVAPPIHVAVPIAVATRAALPAAVAAIDASPSVPPADSSVRVTSTIPRASRVSPAVLLIAGWIAGAMLALLPMVGGLWQVRLLRRSGLPWLHGQLVVEGLAREAGIHRRVEVRLHEGLPGPMTCGIIRPAIVLPQDAENWEAEDLNRAIVHELEHVRRGDRVSQCLARAVCAVYWFHPLVWIAWRQLSLEAERSCDDAVLRRSDATAYADQLVGLARRLSLAQKSPAANSPLLAMANRADLATRVGAVLDSRQRRGRAGMVPVAIACGAAAALVIVMSPLMLVASPQAAAATPPKFEVASIRPSPPAGTERVDVGLHMDGAQVRIVSLPMRDYIARAYRVKLYQVTGPDWITSERFDVNATLPAGSTPEQIPEMLQFLLEERFQMKLHRDKKELPVYALTIGKPPLKLQESAPDAAAGTPRKGDVSIAISGSAAAGVSVDLGNGSYYTFNNGKFEIKKVNMDMLARQLERYVDRPIVDMTDLKGNYDLTVAVTPEDYQTMLIRAAVNAGMVLPPQVLQLLDSGSIASLIDGLQQLGLKMEARKAPLDLLVIDQMSKTPTEN